MSSERWNLVGIAALMVTFVLLSVPVSAGLILPGDQGYGGIASYGNNFHFTPFTPASELSNRLCILGRRINLFCQ